MVAMRRERESFISTPCPASERERVCCYHAHEPDPHDHERRSAILCVRERERERERERDAYSRSCGDLCIPPILTWLRERALLSCKLYLLKALCKGSHAFFQVSYLYIFFKMRKSEPFHGQILSLIGENAWAEPIFWFCSVTLGILGCRLVYKAMQALSPFYFSTYMKLSKMEKVEWDNRGFSTAHAVLISAVAGHLLIVSDFFRDDAPYGPAVFRSSIFSQLFLGVSIGYFISDLAMILHFYPALGGKEFVLHHLLSMSAIAMSLYSTQGNFYLYVVLFSEITTPFVNLRWYLSMAGMKNSTAYVFNGVLLFFGWLIARVLLFVYFFVHIYLHYNQVKEVFAVGFYYLFIAPPSLAVMNVVWFYKIARGIVRTLSKRA